jgi:SAM-dependent methyltransferase
MDVVTFREFYASAFGGRVSASLAARLKHFVRQRPGQIVMGLGFAPPYLPLFGTNDSTTLAFMQARQGVARWPQSEPGRAALVDECELPLLESVIDVALVVHGLEFAETPLDTLHEIWRVLSPQGKLILIVPNRRGLWAASESSPFGDGQPFSRGQIAGLLKQARFTVTRWDSGLHFLPSRHGWALAAAPALEALGRRLTSRLSGVIIVEAEKQVYAFSSGKRARRFVQRFRPVLLPSPQPVPFTDDSGLRE